MVTREVYLINRPFSTLRIQVLNNYILAQNLSYNYNDSKPKYLVIGYTDHVGKL